MDVKGLQEHLAGFAAERDWGLLHSPKNLAMALASEAGTLLDLLKWLTEEQSRQIGSTDRKEIAADTIAAIVLYAFWLADRSGIDVEQAIRKKIAQNVEMHPLPAGKTRASEPAQRDSRAEDEIFERARRQAAQRTRPPPGAEPPARQAARSSAAPSAARTGNPSHTASVPRHPQPSASVPRPAAPAPVAPEETERYPNLDPGEASRVVQSLARRADGTSSEDPVIRELRDELVTLKRTLYSSSTKREWIAGSLRTIRRMLEEASSHGFADDLKAREHLGQIDDLLKE